MWSGEMNPTGNHEVVGSISGFLSRLRIGVAVNYGVGCKLRSCARILRFLDLESVLSWLWHRPAAVALIQPLAWELPYAASVALKSKKKKKKKGTI